MIEVNLLPGPKKKKGSGGGLSFDALKELPQKISDPLLMGAIGAIVISVAVSAFIYFSETSRLQGLEPELLRVQRENRRFSVLIRQKEQAERLRDSLVAELQAIRSIDGDRYVWPHIMEEVTKALPDFTWLVGLSFVPLKPGEDTLEVAPIRFTINGRSSQIEAYTRFLRQLSNSPWFAEVTAGGTQQVTEADRQVISFDVTVTFKQADSAFIRTRPLTESVR